MKQIAKKLSEIMAACSYIQKDKQNKEQNYKYVSAAAVMDEVNEQLASRNIASQCLPEILSVDEYKTFKGTVFQRVTVRVTVKLIDADSGESIDLVGIGCGADMGDKAVMKAQTAAIKYAWMLSLNISTGDDPEADEKTDLSAEKSAAGTNTPASQNRPATAKSGAKSGQNKLVFKAKIDGKYSMLPIEQTPLEQLEWYAANSTSPEHKAAAAEYLEKLKEQANDTQK